MHKERLQTIELFIRRPLSSKELLVCEEIASQINYKDYCYAIDCEAEFYSRVRERLNLEYHDPTPP